MNQQSTALGLNPVSEATKSPSIGWTGAILLVFNCRTIGQCSIQFENYVVLIGGTGASYETSVAVYDDSGFQYNLPNLQNKRTGHACGYYYKDGDLVKYHTQCLRLFFNTEIFRFFKEIKSSPDSQSVLSLLTLFETGGCSTLPYRKQGRFTYRKLGNFILPKVSD